jgi:hypothetical protein
MVVGWNPLLTSEFFILSTRKILQPAFRNIDFFLQKWQYPIYYFQLVDLQPVSRAARYSVWLRAGRPGDRGSIPSRGERIFSLASAQTGSGAHPTPCTMGTGGPFPGVKRCRGVTLTTHPHLVSRLRMNRSYNSSPPKRLHGG